jgi:sodium transport system permease protein
VSAVDPALAHRRGGIAAACLLVILADSLTRLHWLVPYAWMRAAWAPLLYYLLPVFLSLLTLPLLGRGSLRLCAGTRPSPRAMCAGLAAGAAGLALFALYPRHFPLQSVPADLALRTFCGLMATIVVGPFMEEWLYRGILWQATRRFCGPAAAICLTAAAFTIGHGPDRIADLPCLFSFGVLLGFLRHRTGSIAPTMLAHSSVNLSLVLWYYG